MAKEFYVSVSKSYEGKYYGTLGSLPINPRANRIIGDVPAEDLEGAIKRVQEKYQEAGSPPAVFTYAGGTYKSFDELRQAILQRAGSGLI